MSTPRRARPALVALVAAISLLLVTACGGDEPAAAPPPAEPTEEAPPPPPPVDPLTGVAPEPTSPLVAVKVDNSPLARPFHRGLEFASTVYVELVEGGATRFLALYSQPVDTEIGPVRSLRESDIELLTQHGRIGVAFTGANPGVLGTFRQTVQDGTFVEVSYENRPELYRLAERRRDARNFFAVPARLAEAAGDASPARDVGLRFDPAVLEGAPPAGGASVVFSDRETVAVGYDPAAGTYSLSWAGAPIAGAAPANVVVQQVRISESGYRDVTGAVTPFTHTIGEGAVHVLRDGVLVSGSWSRPDHGAGTALVDGAGRPIALKPGPTWVLLQPQGLPFNPS
ncbi:MAG TPA: DUF3048 domain-containing protein [Mycobacteriales bacterium]|nr:DUF3048 domain-containing protein [Mycobacteriales bacterium]